MLNNYILYI